MSYDFESEAKAKLRETDGLVTLFSIAYSELKLKEITVKGQGSFTVTVKVMN